MSAKSATVETNQSVPDKKWYTYNMIDHSKQAPAHIVAGKYGVSPEVYKAWDDGNCQIEPYKSIDDAMDPEAGTIMAIAFGSN